MIPLLKITSSNMSYKEEFFKGMQEMREENYLTDCEVQVKTKNIACHSFVLANSSQFFKAKFNFDSAEKENSERKMNICLDNLDPMVVETLLNYFYSGDITMEFEKIQELVEACEYLLLFELKKKCEKYIEKHITANLCMSWSRFASKHSLQMVLEECSRVMTIDFKQVVHGEEFCDMTLCELMELMKTRHTANEDFVLQSCVTWLKHDIADRNQHIVDVFNNIKLEKCSLPHLKYLHENCQDIMANPEIQSRMIDAMLKKGLGDVSPTKPKIKGIFYTCITDEKIWIPLSGLTKNFDLDKPDVQCCKIPHGVFVWADTEGEAHQCFVLDPLYMTWNLVQSIPWQRTCHAVVSIGHKVYILGGMDNKKNVLNSVLCLDLENGTFANKAPMIHPTNLPLAASIGIIIYVLIPNVSRNSRLHFKKLQCYDSVSGKWCMKNAMPDQIGCLYGCVVQAVDDKLFVVGGMTPSCVMYDPKLDEWTTTLCPPVDVHMFGGSYYDDGKIVLLGGYTKSNNNCCSAPTDAVTVYELAKNAWSKGDLQLLQVDQHLSATKVVIKTDI